MYAPRSKHKGLKASEFCDSKNPQSYTEMDRVEVSGEKISGRLWEVGRYRQLEARPVATFALSYRDRRVIVGQINAKVGNGVLADRRASASQV